MSHQLHVHGYSGTTNICMRSANHEHEYQTNIKCMLPLQTNKMSSIGSYLVMICTLMLSESELVHLAEV